MRLVLAFAIAALLAGCANQPGETGGFSSHYFKNPPPDSVVIRAPEAREAPPRSSEKAIAAEQLTETPEKAAEAPAQAARPSLRDMEKPPAPEAEPAADLPLRRTGFSSRHFRKPLTREEITASLEARVFTLVVQERRRIDPDAKPLVLDPQLAQVAREHSEDMAKKNYVAHANPEGETTASMLMDRDVKFRGILGENIASQNYNTEQRMDLDEFAQRFVDTWLASEDHKANLAYAPYERTGIGIAVNSHAIYVTQLFASDLGLPEPPDDPPPGAEKLKKQKPKE